MTKHRKKRSREESSGQQQYETIRQTIHDLLSKSRYSFAPDFYIGHDVFGDDYAVHFFLKNLVGYDNGLAIQLVVPTRHWDNPAWDIVMANIRQRIPCPVIIVYPETGLPSERVRFLTGNVDGKRLLAAFTPAGFLRWWESEQRPRRLHAAERWKTAKGSDPGRDPEMR